MSTVVIEVDDKVSLKLFMDLAKKLQLKAKVLTETQKEDFALLSMMEQRKNDESVDVNSTLELLSKIK